MESWEDPNNQDAGTAATPPQQLPAEGHYIGTYSTHETGSTPSGTSYIKVFFDVPENGIVAVPHWITEKTMGFVVRDLNIIGWNGDPVNVAFSPPGPTNLRCSHEAYKGKMQARWQIHSPPQPANASMMQRLAALAKSMGTAPPPPSANKPPAATHSAAPPPATPPKSAPPPPRRAAAPPPRKEPAKAAERPMPTTQEECWAYWIEGLSVGDAEGSGDTFWSAVDEVRGSVPIESMTAEHWKAVGATKTPF